MSRFACLVDIGLLRVPAAAWAQHAEPALVRPVTGNTQLAPYPTPALVDTVRARTLPEAFGRGRWHGRLRNYTVATWNRGSGPDYFANGLGGGLRFETAPFHGLQVGAGGFAWVSVGFDNLLAPDAATGAVSRYEVGLFDVTNPSPRQLSGWPEELFVRYRFWQSAATFIRQLLNTPLLNAHDGRLSPGYEQGLWLDFGSCRPSPSPAAGSRTSRPGPPPRGIQLPTLLGCIPWA